jgi:hypothetical protein
MQIRDTRIADTALPNQMVGFAGKTAGLPSGCITTIDFFARTFIQLAARADDECTRGQCLGHIPETMYPHLGNNLGLFQTAFANYDVDKK